jgi:hypothetical protein
MTELESIGKLIMIAIIVQKGDITEITLIFTLQKYSFTLWIGE